jgi:branched-chain amino acid aminotransferase
MDKLGLKVEERDVLITGLDEFEEIGACGTAAAVTPIYEIVHKENVVYQKDADIIGFVSNQLSKIITDIQVGDLKLTSNWIVKVH